MQKSDLMCGLRVLSAAIPMLFIISCVNDDYDFSKEMDLNANLLQNTALPVGSIEKIAISDILKNYSENESDLTYDSEGNLGVLYSGDEFYFEHKIEAPELPYFASKAASDFELPEQEIKDCVTFRLDQLPDFLRSDNIILDLVDIRLDMLITNNTPFGCTFSSLITADQKIIPIKDLHIDKGSVDSPLIKSFSFSEGNTDIPEGSEAHKIEGLTSIVESLPEVITISDFDFTLDPIDFTNEGVIDYVPGATYIIRSDFSVYIPLAFGPEFKAIYSYTMDYDIDFGVLGIPSAQLEFDVVNTLPLNVALTVDLLDENEKVLPSTSITVPESQISAGTSAKPASTHFSAAFENDVYPVRIGGFRFNLQITSSEGDEFRAPVNINDGIEIKNVKIVIPEGVNVDLGEII